MSGHSRWHKVQHKKGKVDLVRSALFTKLTRAVAIAAAQGGGDPEMNFSLRLALAKAKAGNVPKDNIARAISRGAGGLKEDEALTEALYEGFGPGGSALMIEAVTDNKNRTVSDIKNLLAKHGGSLGGPGSVAWQFVRLGVIRFGKNNHPARSAADESDLELALIEAGADDIVEREDGIEIRSAGERFQQVLEAVKSSGLEPDEAGLEWVAKEEIRLEDEMSKKLEGLYEALGEMDDVKSVYTNA